MSELTKQEIISENLAKFLDMNSSIKITRLEITKLIVIYIKKMKLMKNDSKILFNPDFKLLKLLEPLTSLEKKEGCNILHLQSYISKHIINQ
jgi:hypothetical protein